jgi:hypothetical protein
LREGEPVSVQELPQGQKRPLSTYQSSTIGQGRDICGSSSSSSLNHLQQQHQTHTPPTPPPVWEWNQHPPNVNPNPNYPIIPNHNVNMANGYLHNLDPTALDLSGLGSNSNPNPNVNGNSNSNMNGNGGPAMDSFFDHGLFGGLTPTVGMGLDGSNGNGNEDDLWTQLFGTFPYVHPFPSPSE